MNDIPANDRDTVIAVLRDLPENAIIDCIRYEVDVILAILEGQRDIVEGRVHSHEEVKEEARRCLSTYIGRREPVAT